MDAPLTLPTMSVPRPPLHLAVKINRPDRLKALLLDTKVRANINVTRKGEPLLIYAVRKGHMNIVQLILDLGPTVVPPLDLDVTDDNQETALHYAAWLGRADMVMALLVAGFNSRRRIDTPDYSWDTPLCLAAHQGHIDIVKLLVGMGADIHACGQSTPLCDAAYNGHAHIVEYLISCGVNVNMYNHMSRFIDGSETLALMVAARRNHVLVVYQLLMAGADVNMVDANGATAVDVTRREGLRQQLQQVQTLASTVPRYDISLLNIMLKYVRAHRDVFPLHLDGILPVELIEIVDGVYVQPTTHRWQAGIRHIFML